MTYEELNSILKQQNDMLVKLLKTIGKDSIIIDGEEYTIEHLEMLSKEN